MAEFGFSEAFLATQPQIKAIVDQAAAKMAVVEVNGE